MKIVPNSLAAFVTCLAEGQASNLPLFDISICELPAAMAGTASVREDFRMRAFSLDIDIQLGRRS
jgi:hypothetical protein